MEAGQYMFPKEHTAELEGRRVRFRSRWRPHDRVGAVMITGEAAAALERSGAAVGVYGSRMVRVDGRYPMGAPSECDALMRECELLEEEW